MIERCFRTGLRCVVEGLEEVPEQVFIGLPFKPPYTDLFEYGVRPALAELGLTPWIGLDQLGVGDLLCKICQGLQGSSCAIIDITEPNPNVHFELGILAGASKPLILIKQSGTPVAIDLQGMEFAEYSDAKSLSEILKLRLSLVTTRATTYPKLAPYPTYASYYSDLLNMLDGAREKVDLTHIRDEAPHEFEGVSEWFQAVVAWADRHPHGRLRRIISISNEPMRQWGLQLLETISQRQEANFDVRVCDWRANFPAVNVAIFDRRRVCVALTGAGASETAGFSVSEHAIADYFVDYYNNIWSRSAPLKTFLDQTPQDN